MRAKKSLEQDIMLGQVAGHRRQGKPQSRWLDSIKEGRKQYKTRKKVSEQGMHKCEINTGEGNGKPLLNNTPCLRNPLQDHQESNQT
jgi:hypothetical protein